MISWSLVAISTQIILYPGFVSPTAQVETVIDKGLTVEMIVRCGDGAGILQFSKPERRYCAPDHSCYGALRPAIKRLCQ